MESIKIAIHTPLLFWEIPSYKYAVSTITKHINSALRDELAGQVVCAKFAHTTPHGAMKDKVQVQEVEYFNLDMILSVGYRVKSAKGVAFRKKRKR